MAVSPIQVMAPETREAIGDCMVAPYLCQEDAAHVAPVAEHPSDYQCMHSISHTLHGSDQKPHQG